MSIHKRVRGTKVNGKIVNSWQVRWRYPGAGVQTYTVTNSGDAKALDAAVKELGCRILKTDPRIVSLSLIGAQRAGTEQAHQEATARSVSVREAFEEWMARPDISRGTKDRDVVTLARLGAFGDTELGVLTPAAVRAWFVTKEATLAPGTLLNMRVALRSALIAQGYGDLVSKDWYKDAESEVEPVYLTPEQGSLLTTAAKAEGFDLVAKVALFCGLRLGEVLGLQVRHLDLETGTIQVRQALPANTLLADGFKAGRLKTKKSRRPVPIPDWLTWELSEAVTGLAEDAVVFKPATKAFWPRTTFHQRWRAMVKATEGVPDRTRFHDLRHTFAKDMLEDGTPIHIVSRLLGHSSVTVTEDVYGGFGSSSLALARASMNRRPA